MGTKTLVKILDGVVDNPNLPRLGDQNFLVNDGTSTIQVNSYDPPVAYKFTARIASGNSYFTVGTDATHLSSVDVSGANASNYVTMHRASGEDMAIIIDVLNSSWVGGLVTDISKLLSSDSVYLVKLNDVTPVGGSRTVSGGSINTIGDKYPNLCEFTAVWQNLITGDLNTGFGKCKFLRYMQIRGTQISGSLNSLLDTLALNGKNGTFGIVCNSIITYNGSTLAEGTQKNFNFSNGNWQEV